MKLGIMSDIELEDYRGGTEYYSEFLTKCAKELYGHQAIRISAKDDVKAKVLKCDFIILLNVRKFNEDDLFWIMENKNYCKIEMDYGFCEAGNGMCRGCPKLEQGNCFSSKFQTYKLILEKAKFIVFLNPHQREFYRKFFGELVNNSIIAMSFYDYPEKYIDEKRFRLPSSYFFTGRFYHEKGLEEVIRFAVDNPMITVYTLGFGLQEYIERMKNINNIVILGTRPEVRTDIIGYMNIFENFLSFPQWEDTGPISVVEAELCGMNLIINDNNKIRTNGWQNPEECRQMINEARDKIFKKVGEYGKS